MEYEYPIDLDWSTDEMIQVIDFFQTVEKAYEDGIDADEVLKAYRVFKKVVPSKAEEKQLFRQFEKESTYVPYRVVKEAESNKEGKIKMKK